MKTSESAWSASEIQPRPIASRTTSSKVMDGSSMKFSTRLGKVFSRKTPLPAPEVLEATAAAKVELLRIMAMVKAEDKAQRLRDQADAETERLHGG